MADSEKMKQIEKIMGEPMALEPTDYEERIRRNLLIISCLAIMAWWFGAKPSGHLVIWGLSFEHLDINALLTVAVAICIYQLFHYVWVLFNKFSYWRVRLTGVKLPATRGSSGGFFGSVSIDSADYKGDDKNSNLYVWMIEKAPRYNELLKSIAMQHETLQSLDEKLNRADLANEQEIKEAIISLSNTSEQLLGELDHIRVNESLRRFDRWFHMMILSQSTRWMVLDAFFPVAVGIIAVIGLLSMIFSGLDYSSNSKCMYLFNGSFLWLVK